ncbi:MAG: RIP metalloprotease RseP [Chitinispirillaceae bacterium]|nr:RIP metalloprotease RseP [Chitinispirillaceae bacterium]
MTFILTVIIGIVVLGIMVFIHELGHFLAAKKLGFRVLAFSIGFGKVLLGKTVNGTEYRLSAIPFGGYVKMAGENPEDEASTIDAADNFQNRPIWQRATVAVAGPIANYLSAILMLWVMFMAGVDRPAYLERAILGGVADTSAAAEAGLMAGDSIVSINGKAVKSWNDFESLFLTQDKTYDVVLVRSGEQQTRKIITDSKRGGRFAAPPFGMQPPVPAVVGQVNTGSPAETAGLRAGDTVLAIDGNKIISWFQLTTCVQAAKQDSALRFDIARPGMRMSLQLVPQYNESEKRRIVGIRVAELKGHKVKYAPLPAFAKCLDKTKEYTVMIFDVLGKLAKRQVGADQLAGPVGIIPASGFIAMQGLGPILNFMALISINLGVLNLFPLIITDGGMLLFLLLEAVRRKPLTLKTQAAINRFAVVFFIMLFLYITFNDIHRMPEMFRMFGGR